MTRPHTKRELHNNRILRLVRQFVTLPYVIGVTLYGWARRLLRSGKSEKVLHAEDQLRQSRARRELRGLPPDHVQDPPAHSDAQT